MPTIKVLWHSIAMAQNTTAQKSVNVIESQVKIFIKIVLESVLVLWLNYANREGKRGRLLSISLNGDV